jgi:RNA polymerase sigma factor (sigma-70 family)
VNDQTDSQLLKAYAENGSEPAFTQLVGRHVDFVYSAARRMVCDPHLAEDVTQGVFVALAKNAPQLADRAVISGWLHRTARNIAAQTVRTIERRRAREQEAATVNESIGSDSEPAWNHIAPHLDDALGELSESDRDALMLRYFERKSAREMAQTLGLSDEAAQKRVSRAVERLRGFFVKRGLTVGASTLGIVLSAHAVQAAPVLLITQISSAASLAGTCVQPSTAITTKAIAMTTLQKSLITVTLIATIGTGLYEARQLSAQQQQLRILANQNARLAGQAAQLTRERDETASQLATLKNQNERLNRDLSELPRLRGEVVRSKSAVIAGADTIEPEAKSLMDRLHKLKEKLEATPSAKIPELQLLTEEDWLDAACGNLDTETDWRKAFSRLRSHGERHFLAGMQAALSAYIKANNNGFPTDLSQLIPYFETPPGGDTLQSYKIVPAQSLSHVLNGGDWFITQRRFIDEENDTQWSLGQNGLGSASYRDAEALNTLAPAMKAFRNAAQTNNTGRLAFSLQQLVPYLTTPEQKAAYDKLTHSK